MKRAIIAILFIASIFLVARPNNAKAFTLPPATDPGLTHTYGDFYSYSLPILEEFYGSEYAVKSSAGQIKDAIVIATGATGQDISTNDGDMDDPYQTPGGESGGPEFETAIAPDPDPDLGANENLTTWDSTLASLTAYLDGQAPIFFFNNNQENSGDAVNQSLWVWAQIILWSSEGLANPIYFELTSTTRDGAGDENGDPYAFAANIYSDPSYVPEKYDPLDPDAGTDYVLSGGAVCLDAAYSTVNCGSAEAVYGPFNHNLGENEAAYAVIAPELNDFLFAWERGDYQEYDTFSMDLKMTELNAGYEQAFILPGTVQSAVPEPSTWLLLGLGMLALPFARRFIS
ncbi:PEP-CTERM sorting domain-containing protein [Pseudodesulfovibrio cashew]|uniref:PEP-CTERM sorting domain-containing protein n=1 Tax=Pseudodesulfovibrio cashew TaxID=2678688 RepID=A0A6I6JD43_9BACT|nr:PEP-CTERM sorting domain-containing protein [Pseudodesulfovibrio cashew]QGY39069.1 PEP-CTERM sorting domain-containing protein [Pseudodesulfovibrio cashew]